MNDDKLFKLRGLIDQLVELISPEHKIKVDKVSKEIAQLIKECMAPFEY